MIKMTLQELREDLKHAMIAEGLLWDDDIKVTAFFGEDKDIQWVLDNPANGAGIHLHYKDLGIRVGTYSYTKGFMGQFNHSFTHYLLGDNSLSPKPSTAKEAVRDTWNKYIKLHRLLEKI